jgi:hypothetical protein
MASKGGAVPVGTDGNDFLHRQRVADHYQKRYIKKKFTQIGSCYFYRIRNFP